MKSQSAATAQAIVRSVNKLHKTFSDSTKGRIARKNARDRVRELLRKLRRALDNEYPQERKASKRRKGHKQIEGRHVSTRILSTTRLAELTKAGVKLKCITRSTSLQPAWFGPRWAVEAPAGTTIATFKKARRSSLEQRALVTLAAAARAMHPGPDHDDGFFGEDDIP